MCLFFDVCVCRNAGLGPDIGSVYKQSYLGSDAPPQALARARKGDLENESRLKVRVEGREGGDRRLTAHTQIPYGELAMSVNQRDFPRPDEELYRQARNNVSRPQRIDLR